MENPVLVEVMRGDYVESVHRGAVAISDVSGHLLAAIGDVERPVFPRSAIKPLQALYLVESGAADAFGMSKKDIALACSSHNGERAHTDGVTEMLAKAGLTTHCLECGAQWPTLPQDRGRLIKADEKPDATFNNCSGKHAGFICATHHLGDRVDGYIKPDHPTQKELKHLLETLSGFPINDPGHIATDGCSIPTYAVPLKNLAKACARFAVANDMGRGRDEAAKAIFDACVSEPHLVAGSKRFDTDVMQAFDDAVLVKTGAEGVYASMIPSLGIGIALKCEDGTTRASEAMMAGVLAALFEDFPTGASDYLDKPLKNRNGWAVGSVRVADGVVAWLKAQIS